MGYTWDKHVPGSNLSQRRTPYEASRSNEEGGPAVPLCLHTWGFGHSVSGSPELSWPCGWWPLFIQASPARPAGSHADPTACRESPMHLCRERMAHQFSLLLASAADSCRPILMSSLNADGSPGYINAIFANVRL